MLKKSIKLTKNQVSSIWEPDEQILMFVRRHWFALWPAYLAVILLVLIICIFVFLFYFLGFAQFLSSLSLALDPSKTFWLMISILILALALFLYLSWMEYYLDITIITNRRVIDIEQLNLLQRRIVSAELISIQDVHSEVKGIFQTALDFGTVYVQTAGEAPNFILHDLPKPSNVVRDISAAASESLNPAPKKSLDSHNEEDLKVHEDEFAKEFVGAKNETDYLAPEAAIEQKELSEEIKHDDDNNKQKIKNKNESVRHPELVSGSRSSSSLSSPSRVIPAKAGNQSRDKLRRESNKKVVRHKAKGEIDF